MKIRLVLTILMLTTCLSCARPVSETKAPTPEAAPSPAKPRNSTDVVKVSVLDVNAKPGESSEALVQVTIEKGYHVNANPPTFPYLRATELEVLKATDIAVNFIVYPNAVTRSFAFAEKPLAVYEGTFNIKAQLKVNKDAKPGSQNLPAKLRVQACDEEVCYAPGTLDLSIPLKIQ